MVGRRGLRVRVGLWSVFVDVGFVVGAEMGVGRMVVEVLRAKSRTVEGCGMKYLIRCYRMQMWIPAQSSPSLTPLAFVVGRVPCL